MAFLKKKIGFPAPPAAWPHYLMLGTLRRFGHEVGFSLPLIAPGARGPDGGPAAGIRVHVYRNGTKRQVWEPALDERRRHVVAWQRDWETGFPESTDDEDLIAVEYFGPAAAARRTLDAQILWRSATAVAYGSVLVATVRLRPAHSRFSPIIHAAHYYACGNPHENFTWLLSLKGDEAPAGDSNSMRIDYYTRSGKRLGVRKLSFPCNSALLVPLADGLAAIGVPEAETGDGVVARFHGGSSQFAIYTIIRNRQGGALGIEHSLAPHTFIYAIARPEIRSRMLQQAVAEG